MKFLLLIAIGCILACQGQPTADKLKDSVKDQKQKDTVPVDAAIPQDEEVDAAIPQDEDIDDAIPQDEEVDAEDEEVYDAIPQDDEVGAPIKQRNDAWRFRPRIRIRHVVTSWASKARAIARAAHARLLRARRAARARARALAARAARYARYARARARALAARALARRRAYWKRILRSRRWGHHYGKRDGTMDKHYQKQMEDAIDDYLDEMEDENSANDETDSVPGDDYEFEDEVLDDDDDQMPEELKEALRKS